METKNSINIQSVYPNPTFNKVSLDVNPEKAGMMIIYITDMNSRVLLFPVREFVQPVKKIIDLNISQLPAGTYFIHIKYDGKTAIKKLVKQQ